MLYYADIIVIFYHVKFLKNTRLLKLYIISLNNVVVLFMYVVIKSLIIVR